MSLLQYEHDSAAVFYPADIEDEASRDAASALTLLSSSLHATLDSGIETAASGTASTSANPTAATAAMLRTVSAGLTPHIPSSTTAITVPSPSTSDNSVQPPQHSSGGTTTSDCDANTVTTRIKTKKNNNGGGRRKNATSRAAATSPSSAAAAVLASDLVASSSSASSGSSCAATSSDPPVSLSDAYRQKRQRNNEAVRKCRIKKKQQIEERDKRLAFLETRVAELEAENFFLRQQLQHQPRVVVPLATMMA